MSQGKTADNKLGLRIEAEAETIKTDADAAGKDAERRPAFAGGAPLGIPFPLRNMPPSDEPRRLPPASCRPSGANAFPLASSFPSGSTE